jgi:lipopolysaccharide transport system permease protein
MSSKQIWTEEIKSNNSIFSVNLREVWHYRDLLFMLVKRDYLTEYKQTILGPIWFFVQPIMTTLIYVLLFGQIAKLSTVGVRSTICLRNYRISRVGIQDYRI